MQSPNCEHNSWRRLNARIKNHVCTNTVPETFYFPTWTVSAIVTNHVQNVRSSSSFGRSYAESVTVAWDDANRCRIHSLLFSMDLNKLYLVKILFFPDIFFTIPQQTYLKVKKDNLNNNNQIKEKLIILKERKSTLISFWIAY